MDNDGDGFDSSVDCDDLDDSLTTSVVDDSDCNGILDVYETGIEGSCSEIDLGSLGFITVVAGGSSCGESSTIKSGGRGLNVSNVCQSDFAHLSAS